MNSNGQSANRRPKVLFVLPALSFGGAERVLAKVANSLSGSIEPSILVFDRTIKQDVSCRVLAANSFEMHGIIDGLKVTFRRAASLTQAVRMLEPDVIISSPTVANLALLVFVLRKPNFIGRCVFRIAYDPFEAFDHRREVGYRLLALAERFLIPVYALLGLVLFPSRLLKQKFESNPLCLGRRLLVIRNFCDLDAINRFSEEKVDDWPSVPVIVSVGRLDPEKNHELLIRAFSLVRSKVSCKLVIIGSGQLEQRLRKLSEVLNVANDVIFLGEQNNPYKFMARSQVFVLSSNIEGSPNALIEAMAVGLPVIATDCTGAKEILEDSRYGLLVPKNDVERLADAVMSIISDRETRTHYSQMARTRAENFGATDSLTKYLNLFHRVSWEHRLNFMIQTR